MSEQHVIIGAGIGGCLSAIFRAVAGYRVLLLERAAAEDGILPICREASAVVSEFHSGAEYPFDEKSAKDCLDGRIQGERVFPEAIYGDKGYSRIIASRKMSQGAEDVILACRNNLSVLRSHYAEKIAANAANAVFGDPSEAFREISPEEVSVKDAGAAFITAQRGINPTIVAAILEHALKRMGVLFVADANVQNIIKCQKGFKVQLENQSSIEANQILIAAGHWGFRLARSLDGKFHFPRIYTALRDIHFVGLSNWKTSNYTILKLEDRFGGMFSPFNPSVAMIYYPPAAHVSIAELKTDTGLVDPMILHGAENGHAEQDWRAMRALHACRTAYPELREAEILRTSSKIAINTSSNSRIRRRIPLMEILPGAQLLILPKWTMAASAAIDSVRLALSHSVYQGLLSANSAEERLFNVRNHRIEEPERWRSSPSAKAGDAGRHALGLGLPPRFGKSFFLD
jgi:glycine/D-amino acid oxidase-like deaminating enzyme